MIDSKDIALNLFEKESVKFGEFILKTGIKSPIYIDLRVLISYPEFIKSICQHIKNELLNKIDFDLICGVPYTAIPFASYLSINYNYPMIMKRKEAKTY